MTAELVIAADVELVLDLHELTDAPTDRDGFEELWAAVEPLLLDSELRAHHAHTLYDDAGSIRLEVVRVAEGFRRVGPSTRFGIVGVRETDRIQYRCRQCSAEGVVSYGPFRCRQCRVGEGVADDRVCDRHVSILDGAMTVTCGEHRPGCAECTRPATFRCGGPRCGKKGTAWCDNHRRPHPRDPDLDFCPPCFAIRFPRCAAHGCPDIGTVRCEHVNANGTTCDRRMCTRHGSRWQVFGSERLGLGRCSAHEVMKGVAPAELLRQIVVGAAGRWSEQAPSLRGFAYNLRKCGHVRLAREYDHTVAALEAVAASLATDRAVTAALDKAWPRWRREYVEIEAAREVGIRLVARLRTLVLQHDQRFGRQIADAIALAEYIPARLDRSRRALLWVLLPEHLEGRLKGKGGTMIRMYQDALDADINFEKGGHKA